MKDQRDYDPGPNAKPLGNMMGQDGEGGKQSGKQLSELLGQPNATKKPSGMQMGFKKLIGQ